MEGESARVLGQVCGWQEDRQRRERLALARVAGFRRSAGRVLPRKAMRDVLSPTRGGCESQAAKEAGRGRRGTDDGDGECISRGETARNAGWRETHPDRTESRTEDDPSRLDRILPISTWLIPSSARIFLPAVAVCQGVAPATPHQH